MIKDFENVGIYKKMQVVVDNTKNYCYNRLIVFISIALGFILQIVTRLKKSFPTNTIYSNNFSKHIIFTTLLTVAPSLGNQFKQSYIYLLEIHFVQENDIINCFPLKGVIINNLSEGFCKQLVLSEAGM